MPSKTDLMLEFFEESEDASKTRFQVELEFVQCLGNPHYLNCKIKLTSCFNRQF